MVYRRYRVTATVLLVLATVTAAAGDRFAADRARWLSTAEQCKPVLNVTEVEPVSIVEAMLRCGMYDEARAPYGFYPLNSYCHAWSCTPTYFIFKYPDVFQR